MHYFILIVTTPDVRFASHLDKIGQAYKIVINYYLMETL